MPPTPVYKNPLWDSIKDSEDDYYAEIQRLALNTVALNELFTSIGVRLNKAKEQANVPSDSDVAVEIDGLISVWKELRKRFVNLVWDSRDVAGQAVIAAEDFYDILDSGFLSQTGATPAQLIEFFDGFMLTLEAGSKDSLQLIRDLKDLQNDITMFKEKWQDAVSDLQLKTSEVLKSLADDLNKLSDSIHQCVEKITELATKTELFEDSPEAANFMLSMFPGNLMNKMLTTENEWIRSQLQEKHDELQAYQDRRDSLRGEIDAVTRRKAAAEHLGVLLTESEGDFRDLLDRIGSIARVWTSIRSCITALKWQVSSMKTFEPTNKPDNAPAQVFGTRRVGKVANLYNVMKLTLMWYQKAVDPNAEIFKNMRPGIRVPH